jgi:hypothetical protein
MIPGYRPGIPLKTTQTTNLEMRLNTGETDDRVPGCR